MGRIYLCESDRGKRSMQDYIKPQRYRNAGETAGCVTFLCRSAVGTTVVVIWISRRPLMSVPIGLKLCDAHPSDCCSIENVCIDQPILYTKRLLNAATRVTIYCRILGIGVNE